MSVGFSIPEADLSSEDWSGQWTREDFEQIVWRTICSIIDATPLGGGWSEKMYVPGAHFGYASGPLRALGVAIVSWSTSHGTIVVRARIH